MNYIVYLWNNIFLLLIILEKEMDENNSMCQIFSNQNQSIDNSSSALKEETIYYSNQQCLYEEKCENQ